MSMKNILFLQIYGGGGISGGTEVYLKNLLKELSRKHPNDTFHVATFNKKNSIFATYGKVYDSFFTRFLENWNVLTLGYRFSFLGFFQYLWGFFWLYRISSDIIEKKKIDFVYSNGGSLTALVAYFLFKKYNVPYILHFHGLFNFKNTLNATTFSLQALFTRKSTKLALQHASHIVGNSDEVVADINSVSDIKKRARVVHCFVDTDIFYPNNKKSARNKLKLNQNDFIFLSPNRLDKDKGIDFLLTVIPILKNQDIKIIFIGNGPLEGSVIKLSKKNPKVMYISQIRNELLPEYIAAADIVWGAASLHYIGLSIIEALACERPIMALNTPSPPDNEFDTLVDPRTIPDDVGYLVEKNPESCARLIDTLSNQRELLEKKSQSCIDFYNREYGITHFEKIEKIIYN